VNDYYTGILLVWSENEKERRKSPREGEDHAYTCQTMVTQRWKRFSNCLRLSLLFLFSAKRERERETERKRDPLLHYLD